MWKETTSGENWFEKFYSNVLYMYIRNEIAIKNKMLWIHFHNFIWDCSFSAHFEQKMRYYKRFYVRLSVSSLIQEQFRALHTLGGSVLHTADSFFKPFQNVYKNYLKQVCGTKKRLHPRKSVTQTKSRSIYALMMPIILGFPYISFKCEVLADSVAQDTTRRGTGQI